MLYISATCAPRWAAREIQGRTRSFRSEVRWLSGPRHCSGWLELRQESREARRLLVGRCLRWMRPEQHLVRSDSGTERCWAVSLPLLSWIKSIRRSTFQRFLWLQPRRFPRHHPLHLPRLGQAPAMMSRQRAQRLRRLTFPRSWFWLLSWQETILATGSRSRDLQICPVSWLTASVRLIG
jgi:hypothetical protein